MQKKTCYSLLVGGGFLLGTLGVKALTSQTAKNVYVHGVACGIRAKNSYLDIVEQAKAEVDDVMEQANFMVTGDAEEAPAGEEA